MFFQPAWFKTNGGSCDSDMLSHNNINMAWLLVKMAWFCFHLVQLNKFWTSNTPLLPSGSILSKVIVVLSRDNNFLMLY
jgi:hypothetical protein